MISPTPGGLIGLVLRTTWDRARYTTAYLQLGFTEKQVQRGVIEYLQALGCLAVAVDVGGAALRKGMAAGARGAMGADGFPDVVGVMPGGRALFVECKRPEHCERIPQLTTQGKPSFRLRQLKPAGTLRPAQYDFLTRAAAQGAAVAVAWHTTDLDHLFPGGR